MIALVLAVGLGTRAVAAFSPDAIDAAARALPRLHSLLVSQRGQVIFERYYNKTSATRPANVKSASKSVIAALVGIAIDRGLIEGRAHAADAPISRSWPPTPIHANAPSPSKTCSRCDRASRARAAASTAPG